jgi:hypothetical protein
VPEIRECNVLQQGVYSNLRVFKLVMIHNRVDFFPIKRVANRIGSKDRTVRRKALAVMWMKIVISDSVFVHSSLQFILLLTVACKL